MPVSKTLPFVADSHLRDGLDWPFGEGAGDQHRYRMVFEESRDAICITSRDGKIIDCNNAAVELFGYSKEELLRVNVAILYAEPADRKRFLEEIDRSGSVKDFELRMRTREGVFIDCLSTSSAQRREDGRVLGYYCIIRNITERNRAQEALRKAYDKAEQHVQERTTELVSANQALQGEITRREEMEKALRDAERKYRGIFENAVEGIFQTTPDGHYIDVNPALARIYGYDSPAHLISAVTNIESQIYVDPNRRLEFKRLVKERGEVRDFEYEAYRKDRTRIWVSQSARVVRDEEGREIYYEGTTIDITRRKRAEEALQRANTEMEQRVRERTAELAQANDELRTEIIEHARAEKELRDSELRYRTLVELSPEIIAVYREGMILFVNNAGAEFVGTTHPNDILGKPITRLFPSEDPDHARRIVGRIEQCEPNSLVQAKLERTGGEETAIEASSAPIVYLGQDARLVVLRDITERKRAEETLLTYQKQLQSLASELALVQEQERRRMATYLHDNIGQALAVLKMKLQELRETLERGSITNSIDRILELNEMAIQETRSLTLDLSPPILYDLGFEAAVEWLADKTGEKHALNVVVQDDKSAKPLSDDIRVVLFQSARELLLNVAKHARARNVRITIGRNDHELLLTVEDDGVGFDTSTLYLHKTANNSFGLFNVRERLRHLGGSVEITSVRGQGTVVNIHAPLKQEIRSDS
ncbi:MAG: hypothetical protein A2X66_03550 [Ignavibacteria bacterium GWA2_54_16]|nr:MAG: hypothetical protein A2X66_03550 [Ignavibacteria bacterium GWA2_54_16]